MRRSILSAILPFVSIALVAAPLAAGAGDAAPDSGSAALGDQLDALYREIGGAAAPEMLAEDAHPDLIVVSTHSVLGELAPCG